MTMEELASKRTEELARDFSASISESERNRISDLKYMDWLGHKAAPDLRRKKSGGQLDPDEKLKALSQKAGG